MQLIKKNQIKISTQYIGHCEILDYNSQRIGVIKCATFASMSSVSLFYTRYYRLLNVLLCRLKSKDIKKPKRQF